MIKRFNRYEIKYSIPVASLAKLKADGMLDDDEFKQAKAKLLAQS